MYILHARRIVQESNYSSHVQIIENEGGVTKPGYFRLFDLRSNSQQSP